MGNCADKVLRKGWEATVGEYLTHIKDSFRNLRPWNLTQFKNFSLDFARKVDISQGVFQRLFAQEWGISATAQPTLFINLFRDFLNSFVAKVLRHPAVIEAGRNAIKLCIDQFVGNSVANQVCNDTFIAMLKKAHKALARQRPGIGITEVLASTAAGATKKYAGAGVKVAFFAVSAGYSQYQFKKGIITKKERNKHLTKRAVATGGSIAGTTICAIAGTALFPGVGTVVGVIGGMVGGMVGDFLGSKAGEAAYGWIFYP